MITTNEHQVKIVEVGDLFCRFCGSKEELLKEGEDTICKICKEYRFTSVSKEDVTKKG